MVLGRETTTWLGALKSNAEVRSPQTARRHGVMFGSSTPKRCSINRTIEVWSKTSEFTHPPLLHGEITLMGTRTPSSYGPLGCLACPGNISCDISNVERACSGESGAVGVTIWSKEPSFSS